mmetsp:Transcript_45290/g.117225  ORF Transcript_45290/g.117225 Transcript_45290/m.117225 type:complete len:83 (+) Transcript_45290:1840-2088(+)
MGVRESRMSSYDLHTSYWNCEQLASSSTHAFFPPSGHVFWACCQCVSVLSNLLFSFPSFFFILVFFNVNIAIFQDFKLAHYG